MFEFLGEDVKLPPGWFKASQNGKLYCFNPTTKEVSHHFPPKYILTKGSPLLGEGWRAARLVANPRIIYYFKGDQTTWNLSDTVHKLRLSAFQDA